MSFSNGCEIRGSRRGTFPPDHPSRPFAAAGELSIRKSTSFPRKVHDRLRPSLVRWAVGAVDPLQHRRAGVEIVGGVLPTSSSLEEPRHRGVLQRVRGDILKLCTTASAGKSGADSARNALAL